MEGQRRPGEASPEENLTPEAIRELRLRGTPPPLGIRTFQALAYRNFRYLWFGQISHAFSLWMEQIARPILVLALTGSAFHLGLILAAGMLPSCWLGCGQA